MKDYKCEYAYRQNDYLYCSKTQQMCGNVKFCQMAGRWKLNDKSVNCPVKTKAVEQPKGAKKRGKK